MYVHCKPPPSLSTAFDRRCLGPLCFLVLHTYMLWLYYRVHVVPYCWLVRSFVHSLDGKAINLERWRLDWRVALPATAFPTAASSTDCMTGLHVLYTY